MTQFHVKNTSQLCSVCCRASCV